MQTMFIGPPRQEKSPCWPPSSLSHCHQSFSQRHCSQYLPWASVYLKMPACWKPEFIYVHEWEDMQTSVKKSMVCYMWYMSATNPFLVFATPLFWSSLYGVSCCYMSSSLSAGLDFEQDAKAGTFWYASLTWSGSVWNIFLNLLALLFSVKRKSASFFSFPQSSCTSMQHRIKTN